MPRTPENVRAAPPSGGFQSQFDRRGRFDDAEGERGGQVKADGVALAAGLFQAASDSGAISRLNSVLIANSLDDLT